MKTSNRVVKLSKYLSYVLRHHPEVLDLKLDPKGGWVRVGDLMRAASQDNHSFTLDELIEVVRINNKKRFEFTYDKTQIRAVQGHTVEGVNLMYKAIEPPVYLYHGTSEAVVESILKEGIKSGNRLQVHLSVDYNTAIEVGRRHGKPIVITVQAASMYQDGCKFYKATNGVWLTDYVAPKYLCVS